MFLFKDTLYCSFINIELIANSTITRIWWSLSNVYFSLRHITTSLHLAALPSTSAHTQDHFKQRNHYQEAHTHTHKRAKKKKKALYILWRGYICKMRAKTGRQSTTLFNLSWEHHVHVCKCLQNYLSIDLGVVDKFCKKVNSQLQNL